MHLVFPLPTSLFIRYVVNANRGEYRGANFCGPSQWAFHLVTGSNYNAFVKITVLGIAECIHQVWDFIYNKKNMKMMKDNKSKATKSSFSIRQHLIWFQTSCPPPPSMLIWNCRWPSQTYSLVLLGGPVREPAIDGYLETCFFRGQEAASMAPPKTSRSEPPQATKMAAPNSNLQEAGWCWYVASKYKNKCSKMKYNSCQR